jgi:hypothetical protein
MSVVLKIGWCMPREEMTVEEVRMQSFQRIAVTVAFSFTCFSVPVLGADAVVGVVGAEKAAEKATVGSPKIAPGQSVDDFLKGRTVPGGGAQVLPGETVGTGEESVGAILPENGSLSTGAETPLFVPTKPDWGGSLASQVQALREQFKKEHQDLLKAYKEMHRQAKEVGKEERDKVKEQFKVQRDEMITRQKELREELKRRFQEFRAEHPEHMELIDAAKERAKEAVRERRGHGGE